MQLSAALLSAITFIAFLVACGNPDCVNTNKVFDDYPFDRKEYQEELIKQVRLIGVDNLTYWLDSYIEKENRTYLAVKFKGHGLCAKGLLLVTDWNKLKDIQRTKGISYRGAKLVGLQFDIPNDSSTADFVYRDVDHVRD
jgi:hypothetical protein